VILDRNALVAHARDSIAKGSRSFALASKLFDKQTRERAWLLYSWCRKCDDIADGQDHGGALSKVENPHERLDYLRSMTDRALAGEHTGEPAFDALAVVVQECRIPHAWPRDLIQGFAMDADDFSPRTKADMELYCYHVAGVVGLMMAAVMGVSTDAEDTLKRANDLGHAFQLSNILRDVAEDADAGRCYLPATMLARADIEPGEHMRPHHRQDLADIANEIGQMVQEYEASARIGARALPFRSRWAVLAAAGIYGDIARNVVALGPNAWDHRVVTSKPTKLGWVIKAFFQAMVR
jgi:15-cis-phytoene synthase